MRIIPKSRIVIRTLCGCERVISDGVIFSAPPAHLYIPLPVGASLQDKQLSVSAPRRRFRYYNLEGDGTTMVYLEDPE